jgi:hypothetical protein
MKIEDAAASDIASLLDEKTASKRVDEAFANVRMRKEATDVALNILGWAS